MSDKNKCPHCGAGLLWSEDRGPHCDGCDEFNSETDLPQNERDSAARIKDLEAELAKFNGWKAEYDAADRRVTKLETENDDLRQQLAASYTREQCIKVMNKSIHEFAPKIWDEMDSQLYNSKVANILDELKKETKV